MPPRLLCCTLLTLATALATPPPVNHPTSRAGDQIVVLHWDAYPPPGVAGWNVRRADDPQGSLTLLTPKPLTRPGFADPQVRNRHTYRYDIRALDSAGLESPPTLITATPQPFPHDDAFLDFLQATAFDYFWREANPANGLVRDRNTPGSPCSIAATGFGLSALPIGIDRGWITRDQGRTRALRTLRTFAHGPQEPTPEGSMGYRGWFYHFLDMNSGHRVWRCELSSIDTALLLAGVLDVRQFFRSDHPAEPEIRQLANQLLHRVDWGWMRHDQDTLTMGWRPEEGFLKSRWQGYNEAMLLYLLGLGLPEHPLEPATRQTHPAQGLDRRSWDAWTATYPWRTNHGFAYVQFEPLFGHQYSHAWIDFRGKTDPWMRAHGLDYFENSRRATLAQQAYCAANPGGFRGYSHLLWGLTACDGPKGYGARGAPPAFHDDGTLAPTAVGGSLPFAPEICLPTLKHLHQQFRQDLWTPYGFRDAFNLQLNWWGPDVLGIDQGIVLLMIENHRSGRVWQRLLDAPEIRRGLARAGFQPFP